MFILKIVCTFGICKYMNFFSKSSLKLKRHLCAFSDMYVSFSETIQLSAFWIVNILKVLVF